MVELRTERLRLRPPDRAHDLADQIAAFSDPDVARFVWRIPSPYTFADAEAFFVRASSGWAGGEQRFFVIVDALTEAFLGVVFVELRDGGEVGYLLAPRARGRGVMSESLRAVVSWARTAGVGHLFLTTDPANVASQRVAERAGFIKTGTVSHDPPLRGGRTESFLYQWWA